MFRLPETYLGYVRMIWQKQWIFGNWKMNGNLADNAALLQALASVSNDNAHIGIAVPFPYLMQAVDLVKNSQIVIGAEDCSSFADKGAYTGEVSATMIKDCGAKFTLIGHSERRTYFNEQNQIIRKKIDNALANNLTPILCVGETLQQRQNNQEKETVKAQLAVLQGLSVNHIAVAYEPVWAIGTGEVANAEQIADMHAFIHQEILSILGENVTIRTLYGGSVNATNAQEILSIDKVNGALVGGASLKADAFSAIIQNAQTE